MAAVADRSPEIIRKAMGKSLDLLAQALARATRAQ
jgi:hypothetical protein